MAKGGSSNNNNAADKPKCVLIMVGLPASGKSTVSKELERRGWIRINQDDMGSRDECYRAMVKAIKKNQNVVLDRCNVQMKERKMWLKDIQEVIGSMKSEKLNKNIVTECAMMKATPEECKQRAKTRIDHPTLKADDPDKIDKVIGLFARQLNVPAEREGFKHVSFISSIDEAKQFVKAITELYQ